VLPRFVQRHRVEDLREGICLVAERSRAWSERAPARAAAKDRNVLKLSPSRAFFDQAFAVAMRATIRRLD
jgi:hypothetical protein